MSSKQKDWDRMVTAKIWWNVVVGPVTCLRIMRRHLNLAITDCKKYLIDWWIPSIKQLRYRMFP